ncbi:MAG: hypothetical protein WC262_10055 [Bacteroidales bacterium]|jgi:hypothetical protein
MAQHYYCKYKTPRGMGWHSIYAGNADEAVRKMTAGSRYSPSQVIVRSTRPRGVKVAGTYGLKDIPRTRTFDKKRYNRFDDGIFSSQLAALRAASNLRKQGHLARIVGFPETQYRSWFETGIPTKNRLDRNFYVIYYRKR